MNRWNIPDWLEQEVIERDHYCVYCGVKFSEKSENRRDMPSWEHIINDARIITRENIALCCIGCNASKGAKNLTTWLDSGYCITRGITRESVADIVRSFLASNV
jgi:5-methylcytosine-specific restriction endonuclease McrA